MAHQKPYKDKRVMASRNDLSTSTKLDRRMGYNNLINLKAGLILLGVHVALIVFIVLMMAQILMNWK